LSGIDWFERLNRERKKAMRKILATIGLTVLALQGWGYWSDTFGPSHLPDRIPIHFDLAGHPDGWGSPSSLIFLPILSLALFAFLTVIARFPSMFNYPVGVTEANRDRLQSLTIDLLAWMRTELICTFALVQWMSTHLARQPEMAAVSFIFLAPVGVILATVAWYIVAMLRAGRMQSAS
jgi:uncharacterized membrane protein